MQRWGFPNKQSPAHKDHALTSRVKELWEKNATQKDMLDVLQAEGFQIGDRELMRLRTRFKLFLRESRSKNQNGRMKEKAVRTQREEGALPRGHGLIDKLAAAILQEADSEESEDENVDQEQPQVEPTAEPLDPAEVLRRQLRQQELQAQSDEKWQSRKRRRRTREWAGLPADAPGEPPRFPSETTLDESKAYLNLDNRLYAQVREKFQVICRDQGVIKKTVAGPEKWVGLLRCLIRESRHLSPIFQQYPEVFTQVDALWKPKNYKTLSLDVICQDVTKRMRVMETRMSIPEAKSALNLNPAQTREVKHAFLDILKADHFTNKFEAGERHWNELKQRWVDGSSLLKAAITPTQSDAQRAHRLRAIEVLARDVMKRLRAENTRLSKQASGQSDKPTHRGPGPGPAPPSMPHASSRNSTLRGTTAGGNPHANAHPRHSHGPRDTTPGAPDDAPPFEIDPSLLLAASDASILPSSIPLPLPLPTAPSLPHSPQHQPQHLDYQCASQHLPPPTNAHHSFPPHADPHMHTTPSLHPHPHPPAPLPPLPISFRLDPRSETPLPGKAAWLGILQDGCGLDEVRALATREHPGTVVVGLQGLLEVRGEEVGVGIADEGGMEEYLGYVRGMGGGEGRLVVVLGRR